MTRTISLPSGYDWDFTFRKTLDSSKERLQRLIDESLSRAKTHVEYELFDALHNSPTEEFYCLKAHDKEGLCIVSASVRGQYRAIAIFPLSDIDIAADYFVDLVSKGAVKIDWSLFL